MDKKFNELLIELHKILKPLGYRKEGANYRLFLSDGLCRIINLQKNRYNSKDKCEFVINIGVYFEKADVIDKRKFENHDFVNIYCSPWGFNKVLQKPCK